MHYIVCSPRLASRVLEFVTIVGVGGHLIMAFEVLDTPTTVFLYFCDTKRPQRIRDAYNEPQIVCPNATNNKFRVKTLRVPRS